MSASMAWLDPVSFLILCPLAGALAVSLLPGRNTAVRLLALFFSGMECLTVFALWRALPHSGWAFSGTLPWLPSVGASYHVAVDALSLSLIGAAALLTVLVVLGSWTQVKDRVAGFHAWVLVLMAALAGTFASRDLLCFYVFWEAVLIPMYFLIGIHGGPGRLAAATKFVIYTAVGSLLMLAAILAAARRGGHWEFSLDVLQASQPLPGRLEYWAFAAFALAFAIKVPLFPLHTWLPQAHVEAPTGGSVLLAGVLLKMGVYGFLRIAFPLFPAAAAAAAPWLGGLAVAGILYGALMALAQDDLKKLVAYSSVSHLGYCMLGICTLRLTGAAGASFLMLSHAVTTGALFFLVGMLYERSHSRRLGDFSGLATKAPRFAAALGFIAFASAGVPGLCGFSGELPVLAAAWKARPLWALGAVLGVVLGAAYLLRAYQRIAFGAVRCPDNNFPDLRLREILVLAPLLLLAVFLGLAPRFLMAPLEACLSGGLFQ